ncbi:MAG: hypothetical protein IT210_26690 [Armatimonadetes bacterium]|nr:hypothetical protein [Armatimonadota bacterium]
MKSTPLVPSGSVVARVSSLHLEGNITPHSWFRYIRYPDGKPHAIAIDLLSDVVYWYRARPYHDPETKEFRGWQKKFKGDKLQRSYESYAQAFGYTKRQVQEAFYFLRDQGYVTLELRTVFQGARGFPNILFIEPVPEAIEAITKVVREAIIDPTPPSQADPGPDESLSGGISHLNGRYLTPEREIPPTETEDTLHSNVRQSPLKRETNTEITPEISTEKQQQPVDEKCTVQARPCPAASVVVASQASPSARGRKPEPDAQTETPPGGAPLAAPDPALLEALCAAGVTRRKAHALIARSPPDRIQAQLEALPYRKADDPAAALVTAIAEDWAPPEACRRARQKAEAKARKEARTQEEAATRQATEAQEAARQAAQDALWERLPPSEQAAILEAARDHLRAENTFLALQMDSGKESRAVALELERLRRQQLAARVDA